MREVAILFLHLIVTVARLATGRSPFRGRRVDSSRRLIGFGVRSGIVDGIALCRMFQHAIRGQGLPKYLSSDHDPLYRFQQWQANLRVLEVTEIKTVLYVPLSHPFVERLISTVRREYLDRILFWGTADLEAKLIDFQHYYNAHRTHSGLGGPLPNQKEATSLPLNFNSYQWRDTVEPCIRLPSQHEL